MASIQYLQIDEVYLEPMERWKDHPMKNCYRRLAALLLAVLTCMGMLTGCEALDTSLPSEEEEQESIETRVAQANPKKALEVIYSQLGKRTGLIEPTEEQLASEVGLDMDTVQQAYVRYVDGNFGADDVYIVLPKDGEDENGKSYREQVLSALRERRDDRIREFENYDVYNSSAIAQGALIFERGGYVVMLMLEDNNSARAIIEKYIPETLNVS